MGGCSYWAFCGHDIECNFMFFLDPLAPQVLRNEIICLFEDRHMPTQIFFWATSRILSLSVLTVGSEVGDLGKVCSLKLVEPRR